MLINALCEYYDILADAGKLVPDGYSNVKISYRISLTMDGKIAGISDDCRDTQTFTMKNGKVKEKPIPSEVQMPRRTEKPGIDANIIEHRPLYIFGLNYDKESNGFVTSDKTEKARKSHEAFKEANLKFLEGLDSPVINAYRAFIENWVPENETDNPMLLEIGKGYAQGYYMFSLNGRPDLLLHEDQQIKDKWERTFSFKSESHEAEYIAQCAITGNEEPIARIHDKITGVYGGLATGSVFIGYKNTAGCSYGKEQAYNSNISETAMKKYTTALNYLLKNPNHRNYIDDITVIYWATEQKDVCSEIFNKMLFGNSDKADAEKTDELLTNLIKSVRDGNIVSDRISSLDNIDSNVDFYIAGLKPNTSRIAVKFVYHRKFGEILQNVALHQNDIQIDSNIKPIPMWMLKKELISPKSANEKVSASLISEIFKSVIYGTPYPQFLLSTLVRRVKTDRDINNVRAGTIKACINRNLRFKNQKEELKLSLDKTNTNQAYLCGRLFAVLEKLQREASNDKLNRTIKDVYFASAASKPAQIFPKLIKLAQNHLKKVKNEKGENRENYFKELTGEIIDNLDGKFPDRLSLAEQGTFMVGYYQQYQNFFIKKEADKKDENKMI